MTSATARQLRENKVFPLSHCFADPDSGVGIVAIQKNGCTTLKRWFLSVAEPGREFPETADVHYYCRIHHALCNIGDPAAAAERFAKCFTIAFVRDPVSRVASAFIDKFVGPAPDDLFEPARDVVEDFARMRGATVTHDRVRQLVLTDRTIDVPYSSAVDYERGMTLREFGEYLAAAPDEHLDGHWRSQAAFLSWARPDLIVRAEAMNEVLSAISEMIGLGVVPGTRHSTTFYTKHTGGPHADLPSGDMHRNWVRPRPEYLYDDALREVVRNRFAADVALYDSAAASLTDAARSILLSKAHVATPSPSPRPASAPAPTAGAIHGH